MSNVPDWRPSRRRWSPGDAPTDSYTKSYYTITKCKSGVADPGRVGRRGLTFSAKISPVYWRMPRDGHPEDDYMSLPVLYRESVGSAALSPEQRLSLRRERGG